MDVIVELLKDRIDVEKEPAMKRQRPNSKESAPKWMAKFQGIAPMWIAEFQEIGPIRKESDTGSLLKIRKLAHLGYQNSRKSAPNIPNSVEIGSGVESRIQRNCFGMDNQQYKLRKVSASLGVSAFMGGYEVDRCKKNCIGIFGGFWQGFL
ncbi:unnamed protein product [Rhizophagus irregularis]|nr:unnamed protein product [Rhizophagus irregularis]CAB4412193.1 unnamed protein product [Rhizophagus irregularis]